ncbi:MAG: ATP-binding protein [Thermodesulfobacteriota bacterium]
MNSGINVRVAEESAVSQITFTWLLHLRWSAVACQLLLFGLIAPLLAIDLPMPILSTFITFQVGSNLYFHYLRHRHVRIPQALFAVIMIWDVIHLTLLVHYTGGPMNPFTFLYLIHVTLGAVVMPAIWSWGLAVVTILCYAALFFLTDVMEGMAASPACVTHSLAGHDDMDLHLKGMLIAYALTALFIVYFVNRIQLALAQHRASLNRLREEKMKSDRLAALATLSAGAAHEFSTPLATIAVASKEMLRTLEEQDADVDLIDDARLIRGQVQRCREILTKMSADAGEHMGEPLGLVTVPDFLRVLLQAFQEDTGRKIEVEDRSGGLLLRIPVESMLRSIKGLLKNAADAGPDGRICLETGVRQGQLYFSIRDEGQGMDGATLRRAGDPFFTTKEPGKGMGLGLFLAKSLAERFEGQLDIHSEVGRGSTVTISFLLSRVAAEGAVR